MIKLNVLEKRLVYNIVGQNIISEIKNIYFLTYQTYEFHI